MTADAPKVDEEEPAAPVDYAERVRKLYESKGLKPPPMDVPEAAEPRPPRDPDPPPPTDDASSWAWTPKPTKRAPERPITGEAEDEG